MKRAEREEMTLEEIGKVFGIGRERVRQIEQNALRKLRHPSNAKHLRPFYEEDAPENKMHEGHTSRKQNMSDVDEMTPNFWPVVI